MPDNNKQDSGVYEHFDRRSQDTRNVLCCVVEAVADDGCFIDVRPVFNRRVMDEQTRSVSHEQMGLIVDVPTPVIAGIKVTPEIGDHGTLIFSDMPIDNYVVDGLPDVEEVSRFHDYSDAMYIPADFRCSNAADAVITITGNVVNITGLLTVNGVPV